MQHISYFGSNHICVRPLSNPLTKQIGFNENFTSKGLKLHTILCGKNCNFLIEIILHEDLQFSLCLYLTQPMLPPVSIWTLPLRSSSYCLSLSEEFSLALLVQARIGFKRSLHLRPVPETLRPGWFSLGSLVLPCMSLKASSSPSPSP